MGHSPLEKLLNTDDTISPPQVYRRVYLSLSLSLSLARRARNLLSLYGDNEVMASFPSLIEALSDVFFFSSS